VSWTSLRFRLVAGGIAALLLALLLAGAGLVVLFERHVARTIAEDLDVHLAQLLAGLDTDPDGQITVTRPPADPRFATPLSGLYWQIGDGKRPLVRSRSLWDGALSLPPDEPPPGTIHHHEATGPAGARVLIAERRVDLARAGKPIQLRVVVATELARVSAARNRFAWELALALSLLGGALAFATWVQVGLGLRPLDRLRRSVAGIRTGSISRLPEATPDEVQPLVAEVNALLDAQQREIERSRGRAADLAHGLKTPLAALIADAHRLRLRGEEAIARDIEDASEAMSRHVDRELARARARATQSGAPTATELGPIGQALIRTLARASPHASIVFEADIPEGVSVPIERPDLAEVLGNLLENAARHARHKVRLSSVATPAGPAVSVEDDGAGLDLSTMPLVMERGVRLDERGSAGLGLAIVRDVLGAYGWRLELSRSALGGLRATISPGK
jgi:signal transduction histidine kinase